MALFDDSEIGIPCSSCGNKTKKRVSWIKSHDRFTCACGNEVRFEASGLLTAIEDAKRIKDNFKRKLRGIGKR